MATTKKPVAKKRPAGKAPARKVPATRAAAANKAKQAEQESNRVFAMALIFTLLSLVFLYVAMMR